ncbi:UNVERIFIED_CONTAM: hypothetical protein Slati_0445000 [Sesamum latifolium]|uniref:Uncharacterized protein n=1 Tax=Sesamum latifolium TaxID=2727402 RepID=A0AAW2XW01_9LAMI
MRQGIFSEPDEHSLEEEETEDVAVSLHAVKGSINCKTLRVNGLVGDKEVLILINSGSTYCFIDEKIARASRYKLENTTPMIVKDTEVRECDLVLGCDSLSNYNPVELDFHQLKVTLNHAEGKLILKALSNEPGLEIMTAHSLVNLLRRKSHDLKGELFLANKALSRDDENSKVVELLQQYDDEFKEPSSLPPEWNIEHCIELFLNVIPRKQHPYRYAYGQKTEIEKNCEGYA